MYFISLTVKKRTVWNDHVLFLIVFHMLLVVSLLSVCGSVFTRCPVSLCLFYLFLCDELTFHLCLLETCVFSAASSSGWDQFSISSKCSAHRLSWSPSFRNRSCPLLPSSDWLSWTSLVQGRKNRAEADNKTVKGRSGRLGVIPDFQLDTRGEKVYLFREWRPLT